MKLYFSVFSLLLFTFSMTAQEYSDSISVNFFLLDECRISQNISGEINTVYEMFSESHFRFKCYFSRESITAEKAATFMKDYRIAVPFHTDHDKSKLRFYGATVAPQVVVYDEKNRKVLYTGRIDNSYDTIGSRRRVVTSRDLRIALSSILSNDLIEKKETTAIGCFLQ